MIPKSKYSRELSLKIEYHYKNDNSTNIGTGFFIKGQDSQIFLVTAKHTFSERDRRENDKWKDVKLKELAKNLASKIIVEKNNQKICDVHSIAFHHEDLIVFNISLFDDEVENIKILYKEEYTEPKLNFFFYGFCNKKFQENLTSPTESDNPYLYTVQDIQSNNINAIKGCSGGGVFIEEDGEFYLVGMLLQRYDAGASFTVFNLPKYLKESSIEDFYIFTKDEVLIEEKEESKQVKVINTKNNFESFNNHGTVNIYNIREEDTPKKASLVDKVSKNQSHIFYRDGYIKPRMVEIEELSLHIAVCPVTFEEYDLFCEDMKLNPPQSYQFQFPREDYPVINVNWNDAVKYCEWLNSKTNQFKYRLPFSEEWDKIAKLNYIDIDKIDNYICHKGNKITTLQRIATKKAGDLGIFDMYGNINEWCDNNYDEKNKIIKGESFNHYFENLDIEINYCLQNESKKLLGFRMIANKIT